MRRATGTMRGVGLQSGPNVIPSIDVLLVLLVIFMVAAPQLTVDLQLALPGPNPARLNQPAIVVDVAEARAGASVLVNGTPTTWAALPQAVLFAGVGAGASDIGDVLDEAKVVVRADQDVAYAYVVAAIDDLQNAGFAKVSLFAQDAEGA